MKESGIALAGLRDRDLRSEGLFVAEGRLLVERSVSSGLDVLSLYADEAAAPEAEALSAKNSPIRPPIPLFLLSSADMDRVAGFAFHRGMFAVVRRPEIPSAGGIAPGRRVLVLPAIVDPGNLGTLIRSALAFGYRDVWLGPASCDPFNRKALRASMGAALSLGLRMAEPDMLAAGNPALAAAMEEDAFVSGSPALAEFLSASGGAHSLVLGNEHDGIPAEWRAGCACAVRIPVAEGVDSLNVAVAGSILMRELSLPANP
jgi:tRNA G18 (ribose-2'-O)-methylase SpoU